MLPAAIDRYTTVDVEPRPDRLLHVESLGEVDDVSLDALVRTGTWRDYVRGVAHFLAPAHGATLRIESNVPRGAGLSFEDLVEEILRGARLRAHGHRRDRRAVEAGPGGGPERRVGFLSEAH